MEALCPRAWTLVLVIVASSFTPIGYGATIRMVASGVTVENQFSAAIPSVPIGTPWSMTLSLPSTTTDSDPLPGVGRYRGLTGRLTVGAEILVTSMFTFLPSPRSVLVEDAPLTELAVDSVLFNVNAIFPTDTPPIVAGFVINNFFLRFDGKDQYLFEGDALSNIVGLTLADSGQTRFGMILYSATGSWFEVSGAVGAFTVTVVPLPVPLTLLLSAMGVLASLGRRQPCSASRG